MDVIAFRLPDIVDRAQAKAELIRQLHSLGKLADDYVGDEPDDAKPSDELRETVGSIVRELVR